MPTFNEYQNDSGYYIRAWTPNTGNINYKIRHEGGPIVEDYDLTHEDDISWDTINSLKALGLIYTEESGTIANDEFEPDPNQVEETALTEDEARRLLDAIREHCNPDEEELTRISNILGIDSPENALEDLTDTLSLEISLLLSEGNLPMGDTMHVNDAQEVEVAVTAEDLRDETENGRVGLRITFISDVDDQLRFLQHYAFICQDHGIEGWKIGYDEQSTWARLGEACRQKGHLLPVVASVLESVGIDPSSPESSPPPEIVPIGELES